MTPLKKSSYLFLPLAIGLASELPVYSANSFINSKCDLNLLKSFTQNSVLREGDLTWTPSQAAEYFRSAKAKDFSPEQIHAIRAYLNHDFEPINEYLRTGSLEKVSFTLRSGTKEELVQQVQKWIPLIDQVVEKAPTLPASLILFRAEKYPSDATLPEIGETFSQKGYTSTSVTPNMTARYVSGQAQELHYQEEVLFVMNVIRIPQAGIKGVFVKNLIENTGTLDPKTLTTEEEILLERGLKFKILKKSEYRYRTANIKLQGMPKGVPIYLQELEVVSP